MNDDCRSSSAATTEVRAAEEVLLEAMGAGDQRALERLIADSYVDTGPTGETIGKLETLRLFESRAFIVTRSELSHVQILPYGDTAIVVGDSAITVRMAEQVVEDRHRFTRAWHRTDDGWQLVATHVSRLGPASRHGLSYLT